MRLVTRGDLDGITSAVLITTMENIESIELVHPQEITERTFQVSERDILANLPYHSGCGMWFDHHELTESNEAVPLNFKGKHAIAPSVARVIYEYYASDKLKKYEHLVAETDRFDSANLTSNDITSPRDIILIGFTIDSRSGIGVFREYFMQLVEWFKTKSLREINAMPEVAGRVKMLKENNAIFAGLLKKHSRMDGNVVITDFRPLEKAPIGNRFLIYTLFPEANVSVRMQWGTEKKFVAVTLGHNIFNRTSRSNCGHICSDFGGGGHKGAGACPLDPEKADMYIEKIVRRLKSVD